jgi:hypothetical protein
MSDTDLERILELRSVVRWSADPRAFDLLRGVRDARWAVVEAPIGCFRFQPSGSCGESPGLSAFLVDRGVGVNRIKGNELRRVERGDSLVVLMVKT